MLVMKMIIDPNRKKIAYVLSQFPSYDETFLLREMIGVEKRGVELYVFSLRPFKDKIIHQEALLFAKRTFYAPFLFSIKIWLAHLYFLLHHPIRYLSSFYFIIRSHKNKPDILLLTVLMLVAPQLLSQMAKI